MKIIITLLLTFCVAAVFAQAPDCKRFKNGTFYYPAISGFGSSVRKGSVQKSYSIDNKLMYTWKVKWTSECSYELIFVKAEESYKSFRKGDRITATITATDHDCFTFYSPFYSESNDKTQELPEGQMCIKRDKEGKE